jgi:hypothetical protein
LQDRDTILTINVVEPGLVRAVKLHSQTMGKELKGLVLVHTDYADQPGRPKDTSGLFKEIICNFDNPDELQTVLKPYQDKLLAVTCRYEEAIQPFRQVIPFLPYIHTPSPSALLWSTEKPLMRDRLSNYDKNLTPKYQYMEMEDVPKLHELIKDFEFPVIVKPSGLSKALLVTRCDTLQELEDCLDRTFKIIQGVYSREQYPGKPGLLVEEMMQGEMYSVDAYVSYDGKISCLPLVKVITAHSVGLPGFYGYERITPVNLSIEDIESAFTACRSAIRALNLSSTTTHIELFRTENGWKIIELAARIGGYRDLLYRKVYGVEHFYNDLAIRMGMEPKMPGDPVAHAVVLNMYADEEGRIESIKGIEEARQLKSIVYLEPHAEADDFALFAANGGNPLVDGVLSNEDPKQLRADVDKVRELVKINVKPTNSPYTVITKHLPRKLHRRKDSRL